MDRCRRAPRYPTPLSVSGPGQGQVLGVAHDPCRVNVDGGGGGGGGGDGGGGCGCCFCGRCPTGRRAGVGVLGFAAATFAYHDEAVDQEPNQPPYMRAAPPYVGVTYTRVP